MLIDDSQQYLLYKAGFKTKTGMIIQHTNLQLNKCKEFAGDPNCFDQ